MPRAYGVTNAAPYASAPAVGAAGDTYFNTTSKTMFLSDGTSWIQMLGAAGPPTPLDDGFTRYGTGTWASTNGVIVDLALPGIANAVGSTYTPNGGNNGFTIPNTGLYDLSGTLSSNAANFPISSFLAIRVNGTVVVRQTANKQDAYETINVAIQRYLTAGDVVSLAFYQASGTFNRSPVAPSSLDPYSPMLSVWRAGTGLQGPAGNDGMPGSAANIGGYWHGQQVTPTGSVLNNDVAANIGWTTLRTSGFSLQSSGQRITPAAAGRYQVTAELSFLSGTNASAYCRAVIYHYNNIGTVVASVNGLGNGTAANQYCEAVADGVFDMVVGDYLVIQGAINNAAASYNPNNVYCSVVPVGGAKGDPGAPGPSGTATAVPPPYYSARKSTAPANSAGVYSLVALDTLIDTNSAGDYTLTGGSITVTTAGYFQVVGLVLTPSSGTGAPGVGIAYWTGSQWTMLAANNVPPSATIPAQVTWEGWLAAGTQIGLLIYNSSAQTWGVVTTPSVNQAYMPSLSIVKAGGAKGDAGATGGQGPAGTTTQALVARGEWSAANSYAPLEIVTRNGVAFLAMASNSNVDPTTLPAGSFAALSDITASVQAIGKQLSWTPVFRQGVGLPVTINAAWYSRVGEWVIGEVNVNFTGSGTAGQPVQMDLPVPIRTSGGSAMAIGHCFMYVGSNTYPDFYTVAGQVNYTQFALGTVYVTTTMANGYGVSGFFMYLAPVGV